MAIDIEKLSTMDLEKLKFRQSVRFPETKDVVAVTVENQKNDPIPTTDVDDVTDIIPFNYPISENGVIIHTVGPNVKQVLIKTRTISRIEIAFDDFGSSPPLWSIPRGGFFQLTDLKLNKQFYIRSERDSVLEILHFT